MFFTSGIIIAFFCFAFYLIWNQFLKKDTRLSTGLQVLRKKISDLENLSVNVSAQISRQMSAGEEKVQKLEYLLKAGHALCDRLERNIEIARALEQAKKPAPFAGADQVSSKDQAPFTTADKFPSAGAEDTKNPDLPHPGDKTPPAGKPVLQVSPFAVQEPPPAPRLRMVTAKPRDEQNPPPSSDKNRDTKKKFQFGKSPFTSLDFIDSP